MKEKEFKNVRWGDIYYCDLGVTNGSVQSGMRPVLVVQTNRLNESSPTVVVAAITAVKKKTAMNTEQTWLWTALLMTWKKVPTPLK